MSLSTKSLAPTKRIELLSYRPWRHVLSVKRSGQILAPTVGVEPTKTALEVLGLIHWSMSAYMPVYIPAGRNRYTTVFRHVSNDESQHIPLVQNVGVGPLFRLPRTACYRYTTFCIIVNSVFTFNI